MINCAGIDPSLKCIAISVFDYEGDNIETVTITPPADNMLFNTAGAENIPWPEDRLRAQQYAKMYHMGIEAGEVIAEHDVKFSIIENYSFGSKGRISLLAEIGHSVRSAVTMNGSEWREAAPSQLKKWATGKGNIKPKVEVQFGVLDQWGERFGDIPPDFRGDAADAFTLGHMAVMYKRVFDSGNLMSISGQVTGYQIDVIDALLKNVQRYKGE